MALTLTELMEKIAKNLDEISILEILDISSEDLVSAFADRIEERFDYLAKEFENDDEQEEGI